jgi:putative endonuclease
MYYVYIVRCVDETLYTGWTTDVEKRIVIHNTSPLGAKYTRARRPVCLVYSEECESKSEALKRECAMKKMTREGKLRLIEGWKKL